MLVPRLILAMIVSFAATASASAGDWPMWRHDPGRTATSNEALPGKLDLLWTRVLPPSEPAYRDVRLQFDAAPEPIVLGKRVFVASNSEDSVTAFDTDTGEELWKFFTNGPVRFAPAAGKGRVIFGSDDGCVYCVKASDGSLAWKKRAVPSERLVLGNGRLISVWPVRGGPLLHEDRVYFAAGVWPLEGTFVFCVDAATGETIWRNDRAAYRYQVHPHNAEAYGGLAPQGYLLIDGDDLVVPSSQAYPARFDLQTGELKEFELPAPGRLPGGWFASTPSEKEALKLKRRGLLFDEDVNAKPHEDKMRNEGLPEIRSTLRTRYREWKFAEGLPGLDEKIVSMVAGDGRLFVVGADGQLRCYGEPNAGKSILTHSLPEVEFPKPKEVKTPFNFPQRGHAVLLGVENGAQISRLLPSTELEIVAVDSSADQVEKLREKRFPGNRVHVIETNEPMAVRLPPYFADLILIEPNLSVSVKQLGDLYQSLRPYGGQIMSQATELSNVAEKAQLSRAVIETSDGWTVITRQGPLEGSSNYTGDWAPSEDQLVKAPLGLLWFGDSVTHFKRSPQPKFIDGVMISNPKDWTDASTRQGKIDYRLLDTEFTDVYTGRQFAADEVPELRQSFSQVDKQTIQPAQYRPPRQKDDWKPDAPRAGERVNPLTGETEPRVFPKSYGCDGGVDYGLLYSMRSGTPAFYDKRIESGTINISGPRSGCTNSIIPANGILNLPYFYEGCTCSYPLPMSLALVSMPETFEQWASWGAVEPGSLDGKIRRLGLNFGAPGDRVTDDGTLWLDVPNVGGPSPEIAITTEPPLEELETFYQHSLFLENGGAGWPWVAGSGVRGIRKVTVGGLKPGKYRFRISYWATDLSSLRFEGSLLVSDPVPDRTETIEVEGSIGEDGLFELEISPSEPRAAELNGIEIIRADLPVSPIPKW
ncbi:MAG: PQQ-like beta-propeller repeat protein [Verrucomicrobiae bacterium]|nr:PQQ-like beta-propeller repeat protein [Verrucomicrobiae bacterium]